MELAQLKQAEEKEQADFDAEMQELARQLNQELKISEIQEDEYHGDLSMDDETKLKRRVTKGAWNIAKDKAVAQVYIYLKKVFFLLLFREFVLAIEAIPDS